MNAHPDLTLTNWKALRSAVTTEMHHQRFLGKEHPGHLAAAIVGATLLPPIEGHTLETWLAQNQAAYVAQKGITTNKPNGLTVVASASQRSTPVNSQLPLLVNSQETIVDPVDAMAAELSAGVSDLFKAMLQKLAGQTAPPAPPSPPAPSAPKPAKHGRQYVWLGEYLSINVRRDKDKQVIYLRAVGEHGPSILTFKPNEEAEAIHLAKRIELAINYILARELSRRTGDIYLP